MTDPHVMRRFGGTIRAVYSGPGGEYVIVDGDRMPVADPYHVRRARMAECPECLDPECHSINCDERGAS